MTTKKNSRGEEPKPRILNVKESKTSKRLTIGFIIFAVIVVGIIGYAFWYDKVGKYKKPVAVVGDRNIQGDELDQRVRITRDYYVNQYNMLMYYANIMADNEEYVNYYTSQMSSLLSYMDDYKTLGEDVLNSLIDNEILQSQADEMGISVSDEEVDDFMQQFFAYYPDGTPTPTATYIVEPTSTLTSFQKTLMTGPTATETPIVEATTANPEKPTEAEFTATVEVDPTTVEIAVTPTEEEPSSTATTIPTPTVYTEELYKENYQEYMKSLEEIGVKEKYFREYVRDYLLTNKVHQAIVANVPRMQDQAWARHILVETEEEAMAVLDRINNGEDWFSVCNEVTLDQSSGESCGDLGWFAKGQMIEEFENAAFALDIGSLSEPVQSSYGWHIIQVLGHEEREVESDSNFEQLQSIYYENWFEEISANVETVINDNWVDHVPSEPSVAANMRISQ